MSDNEFSGCDDRVLTVIDTELLIREIEKRPALYNKQMKQYSDRVFKEKMWGEVCVQVIENWNELPAEGKKNKGAEVQKKWKNLKDCFQRELAAQRKTTSGQGAKKRRKYVHFDELLFLTPFVQGRETSSNISRRENDEQAGTSSKRETEATAAESGNAVRRGNNKKSGITSYEESLLDILKSKQNEEFNEDKNFALMLVPMLAKLNDEQKHYAKVEILNVMRNARLSNIQQQQPASQPLELPVSSNRAKCNGQTGSEDSMASTSLQIFYNDFASSVASPSSTSESEVFDLSLL